MLLKFDSAALKDFQIFLLKLTLDGIILDHG